MRRFDRFYALGEMPDYVMELPVEVRSEVLRLRRWAAKRHGDQQYGAYPYYYHLDMVASVAVAFFEDAEVRVRLVMGALMHDLLEDTDATAADLLEIGFPENAIADAILVTDAPGKNRKEKKAATLLQMRGEGTGFSTWLKLSDRAANVSSGAKNDRYRTEQAQLEEYLYLPDDEAAQPLWQYIRECLGLAEL